MNTTLAAVVIMAAADNWITNAVNSATVIIISIMGLLALIKLVPLIMKGRLIQIIGAIVVITLVLTFAANTNLFTDIGEGAIKLGK